MPMEMKEKPLTFRGSMAFIDIDFSAPVRNVEAMLKGHGEVSAIKISGRKVRLAAQCQDHPDCSQTRVLVAANTANT